MEKEELEKLLMLKCLKCGNVWMRRKLRPKRCPHCQNRRWDMEKK